MEYLERCRTGLKLATELNITSLHILRNVIRLDNTQQETDLLLLFT